MSRRRPAWRPPRPISPCSAARHCACAVGSSIPAATRSCCTSAATPRTCARHAQLAPLLPDYSGYLLAYRGYGASDGTPNEAALIGDALALYDHVRAAKPHAEIAVLGRSLGSGVASQLAAWRPLARLVLVTPFDSLAAAAQAHYPWAPVRWLLRDRYDSASALRGYRGSLLVLRAGRDQAIPASSTQRLLDALPQQPKLVALPHAGHDDLNADPRYAQALRAFLH
ncbi:alpha/beta hydrolase [Xanthomonas cerealis]|uniref:alpha/beta hydrolase n=1 Tax=Xanthomonas cerealis TaxID=3390025 RepID=UPI0028A855B2|nr:alpha/beta hydrolase [Xanthomonas translucens]